MKISSSLPFLSLFLLAKAYTWQFTSQPSQCEDITITLQGSGKPPYRLLIVPHGSTPLPNGTEVRRVQDIPFSESSTTFKLPYPENSSFIAVVCSCLTSIFSFIAHVAPHFLQVSDSSGFGSGGASIPVSILQSSDSSCYDASQTLHPAFDFYINPSNGLTQCETGQLWWGPNVVGCVHLPVVRYSAHPNRFRPSRHVLWCNLEHRIFTASYQVALRSPSPRVRFLATMSLALPSIGLSTWYLGPPSLWSGVMVEGLDPAVMLNSLFLLRRIPPV